MTNKPLESAPDAAFMQRALKLAARGQGAVEPNPMVGCVIVRRGNVVAEGWHHRFGQAHAELDALNACRKRGIDPAGCDVYVTLEPCSHHGKTPPCADALIEAKVGRVLAAMKDPFDQVAGRGAAKLRRAGIPVEFGLCGEQAAALNAPYLKRVTRGLPWVVAKWAQTIDGRIAARTGDSKWVSCDASRRLAHALRARVDAIIVGSNTAQLDDPLLTARDVPIKRVARRIVIDPSLRLTVDSQLVRSLDKEGAAPLTLIVREEIVAASPQRMRDLQSRGVEIVAMPVADMETGRLALRPLLRRLCDKHGATNVLAEGGGRLIGGLLAERLIDQAMVFVAPRLLADERAVPAATGLEIDKLAKATRFVLRDLKRVGDDVMLDYLLI
jgi:diaminohydroxyphosphoribosylaminopyrimidine deaminase/5-amino-6-(5-phosphoribosylamino)uracil reductase